MRKNFYNKDGEEHVTKYEKYKRSNIVSFKAKLKYDHIRTSNELEITEMAVRIHIQHWNVIN